MSLRHVCVAACVPVLLASPALAQEPAAAGRIKIASGEAFVVRDGAEARVEVGQPVLESDVLRTGRNGRIGVTLEDDTRVSLGPDSEVRLDSFRYAPAEGSMALAVRFLRGVAVYVSGQIARLAPDAVRLETPQAIVGVRGTTLAVRITPE
jgi:hypothetical protein